MICGAVTEGGVPRLHAAAGFCSQAPPLHRGALFLKVCRAPVCPAADTQSTVLLLRCPAVP